MSTVPNRATFEDAYAGTPPWDNGKPSEPLVAIADKVVAPVLDAGCGTGENALFFAARGFEVTGFDFVDEAIRRARAKATERGLTAEFLVADALALGNWLERFASVIDSGLFHVFSDEDRARYVAGLTHVTQPGGRLFLICFRDDEPGTVGPRRISQRELREAFANGWELETIEAFHGFVNPQAGITFSEGGPKCWFAVFRRNG